MSKERDFASILAELEKVVGELGSDVPIERALELFERGMKLSSECENFLNAAEQRVEILRRSANGVLTQELHEDEKLDIIEPGAIS
ncbi:MAG: exodeoxyribonuclease VII small subunit [Candidatus Melainabacteria bacterium]|nr:MAG: exodeoxyribonuclease VII small subunit [Candidatus Melainabacteria bacterium]